MKTNNNRVFRYNDIIMCLRFTKVYSIFIHFFEVDVQILNEGIPY